jgi:hypothetical protein
MRVPLLARSFAHMYTHAYMHTRSRTCLHTLSPTHTHIHSCTTTSTAGKIQSRKGTPVRFLGAAQTGNMAADGSKAEGGAMRGGGGEEGHVAGLGRAQCGDMAANDGGEGPGVGTREGGMSGGADRRSLIPNEDLLAVLPLPILKHVQV